MLKVANTYICLVRPSHLLIQDLHRLIIKAQCQIIFEVNPMWILNQKLLSQLLAYGKVAFPKIGFCKVHLYSKIIGKVLFKDMLV